LVISNLKLFGSRVGVCVFLAVEALEGTPVKVTVRRFGLPI
jgi:hypothetical protein